MVLIEAVKREYNEWKNLHPNKTNDLGKEEEYFFEKTISRQRRSELYAKD
jgi:hypothetical protein